jgi:hypothetical protein
MQKIGLGLPLGAALCALALVPRALWALGPETRVHLDHAGADCPTGWATEADVHALPSLVRSWSFDPACVWDTIQRDARDEWGKVRGFAFGVVGGLSRGAGYSVGNEVVVFREDARTLRVGVVAYRTVGIDVTLPVGASLTQSVVYGDCAEGLTSYLGWFEGYSAIAKTLSLGRRSIVPFDRELTGCDAHTSTRGMTSPIAGVSTSYYWLLGQSVLVDGPGAQPLLDYFDSVNLKRE